MTTLNARPTLSRRSGLLAATLVAAVAIGAAVPSLVTNYGPWADDESTLAEAALPAALTFRGATTPDITQLEQRVKDAPQDFAAHLSLANAYLQAVRETGDPTLYAKADAVLVKAVRLDSGNPELLATEGILALGRHEFADALRLGKEALAADPERARYYGIVADAQVELGLYDEAVTNLQEMVNRRPDFNSFSRISYLRELHGDPEGAIEAMEFAIEAGTTVPENAAWAHAQAGNLYFGLGRHEEAARHYDLASVRLPDHGLALAGHAQVAAAKGDYTTAAALYTRAFERMPLPAYAIALGDIARVQGDTKAADRHYATVRAIDALYTENGTNTDFELALFLADHGLDLDQSLQKARAAYAARPSVQAADVLAWTLYQRGEISEAQRYATEALRLGSRDSLTLFHAGMIEKSAGNTERAKELLSQLLNTNPRFSVLHADEAKAALSQLG